MQLKNILSDDDAVSPVIGVILMVAITVILAAVIASFVLGLGDQAQQTTPQASFSFDYDGSIGGASEGELKVVHDGGDSIEAQELFVRGDGITADITGQDIHSSTTTQSWEEGHSPTAEMSAGNSVTVAVDSDYELQVVYEPIEGDTSATLAKDSGPDA